MLYVLSLLQSSKWLTRSFVLEFPQCRDTLLSAFVFGNYCMLFELYLRDIRLETASLFYNLSLNCNLISILLGTSSIESI